MTAASLQLEAAIPNFAIHELHRYALLEGNRRTCKYDYMPVNGKYQIPTFQEVIDLAKGQSLPQELQDALYDPEILKTAFNASFERTCLSAFMGRVTPPEQWSCTAVMARELGLPEGDTSTLEGK